MSWTTDLYIGELRPWPDVVHVRRGWKELRRYVPERMCHLEPWEVEQDTGFYDCMKCGCGYVADIADWNEWRFCPNCGAKMVDA